MKFHIFLPPDGKLAHIEADRVASMLIHVADQQSLCELQEYARSHRIEWREGSYGFHMLLLPWGTVQQRLEEHSSPHVEVSLVHLPTGGTFELRRVTHQSIDPRDSQVDWVTISTIGLFRPLA